MKVEPRGVEPRSWSSSHSGWMDKSQARLQTSLPFPEGHHTRLDMINPGQCPPDPLLPLRAGIIIQSTQRTFAWLVVAVLPCSDQSARAGARSPTLV